MQINYITRQVDDLGRICIPKELRAEANITYGDTLEIAVLNGAIIMGKVEEKRKNKDESSNDVNSAEMVRTDCEWYKDG